MINENNVEYWRIRALQAEEKVASLERDLLQVQGKYQQFEISAGKRFDEACRSFETLIIDQLKQTSVGKPSISPTANNSGRRCARAPPPPPALSIDTTTHAIAPHLALKPRRAPPVPPGKAFGGKKA